MSDEMDFPTARAALREAEAMSARAVERLSTPWWYELVLNAILASLFLSMAAPPRFAIPFEFLMVLVLGLLVWLPRQRYGVWLWGVRAGRSRKIVVTFMLALAMMIVGVHIAYSLYGAAWVLLAAAGVAVVLSLITNRLWIGAYRVETGRRP